ncbi:MAG: DUF3365 domain-containing protein, partial [Mycobacterium leprae]
MARSLVVKFMAAVTGIIIAVLVLCLAWDFQYQEHQADNDLLAKADLVAKEQEASRFSSSQGGQQAHAARDARQGLDQLFANLAQSQVKQTRLLPRDGRNTPDEFERQALMAFGNNPGSPPIWQRLKSADGNWVFRYIKPLRVEESCLTCHGDPAGTMDTTGHRKEGMKVGDVAGGISVTLDANGVLWNRRVESIRLAAGVMAVAVASLIFIWVMLWRQVSLPMRQLVRVAESVGGEHIVIEPDSLRSLEANRETAVVADALESMSHRLAEMYEGLEQKVEIRTAQLQTANRELERASRHQSEFLTMVSHDFKTPLTSIMTFTELLLDRAAGQINQEQQEYLTDVMESSQRLLHMVNDLLDLSRLDAGKVKLFRELLSIKEILRDAETSVRPLAEKKQVQLIVDLSDDLPLVQADGLRVTQVLLNLLGNAVKFTPAGGSIRVSARENGDYLEVSVADTGIGIAPEEQKAVFERF